MSVLNPVYIFTASWPHFGATDAVAVSVQVNAAFLENHGETYLLRGADGEVVAAFPLGTVIVRNDALVDTASPVSA